MDDGNRCGRCGQRIHRLGQLLAVTDDASGEGAGTVAVAALAPERGSAWTTVIVAAVADREGGASADGLRHAAMAQQVAAE